MPIGSDQLACGLLDLSGMSPEALQRGMVIFATLAGAARCAELLFGVPQSAKSRAFSRAEAFLLHRALA
jgi:hypothetical protein